MKLAGVGLLILTLSSCVQKEQNKTQVETYFNLKSYFEKEADRLNNLHLQLDKSVTINGETERKQVKINDFKNELNVFIAADINKASWRGAFTTTKTADLERYTTNNEKIPVKKVEINYQNNKIKSVQVLVVVNNILYHSIDSLTYFPDSLYMVNKTQKIKLIKEKKYIVVGRLK